MSDAAFDSSDSDQAGGVAQTLGTRLTALREARSLTVGQVAGQLYLAPRQVQALENDDYAALPAMAVVRGFVRNYAKLLKVDAEPLVALLPRDTVTPAEALRVGQGLAAPFAHGARMPTLGRSAAPSRLPLIALIMLLLLSVAAYAAYRLQWISLPGTKQATPMSSSAVLAVPATVVANATDNTAADAESPATPTHANETAGMPPGTDSTATDNTSPEKTPAANVIASVSASATPTVADTRGKAAAAAEKNALVLTARENSWVDLRRAGSKSAMTSRLFKAGTTETFEVAGPMVLTVGNASGVDGTFRGTPLDMKRSTIKNNVARLILKQE